MKSLEDKYLIEKIQLKNNRLGFLLAIFDGYSGSEVANYAFCHFIRIFYQTKSFKTSEYDKALSETFLSLDDEIKSKINPRNEGSSACVILIT